MPAGISDYDFYDNPDRTAYNQWARGTPSPSPSPTPSTLTPTQTFTQTPDITKLVLSAETGLPATTITSYTPPKEKSLLEEIGSTAYDFLIGNAIKAGGTAADILMGKPTSEAERINLALFGAELIPAGKIVKGAGIAGRAGKIGLEASGIGISKVARSTVVRSAIKTGAKKAAGSNIVRGIAGLTIGETILTGKLPPFSQPATGIAAAGIIGGKYPALLVGAQALTESFKPPKIPDIIPSFADIKYNVGVAEEKIKERAKVAEQAIQDAFDEVRKFYNDNKELLALSTGIAGLTGLGAVAIPRFFGGAGSNETMPIPSLATEPHTPSRTGRKAKKARRISRAKSKRLPHRARKAHRKARGKKVHSWGSSRKHSGRKLKFGSPAWRKKYMKKRTSTGKRTKGKNPFGEVESKKNIGLTHKVGTEKQYSKKGGAKVYHTKHGQPYIILSTGKARFLKKSKG